MKRVTVDRVGRAMFLGAGLAVGCVANLSFGLFFFVGLGLMSGSYGYLRLTGNKALW